MLFFQSKEDQKIGNFAAMLVKIINKKKVRKIKKNILSLFFKINKYEDCNGFLLFKINNNGRISKDVNIIKVTVG